MVTHLHLQTEKIEHLKQHEKPAHESIVQQLHFDHAPGLQLQI